MSDVFLKGEDIEIAFEAMEDDLTTPISLNKYDIDIAFYTASNEHVARASSHIEGCLPIKHSAPNAISVVIPSSDTWLFESGRMICEVMLRDKVSQVKRKTSIATVQIEDSVIE